MNPRDPYNEATRSNEGQGEETGPRALVFWDDGFTSRALTPGKTLIVGRALDCDVQVVHPSVSRRHLAIHAGPPICVEDLGSANGTRLAGQRLRPDTPVVLEPGSVVEAGAMMLVVHVPGQADEPAASTSTGAGAQSTAMKRLDRLTQLVASSGLSVILFGETGVGKEVVAERVHRLSPRASGPFVRLNCAAMPEALLESELFGHERGAFTGAIKNKQGLLEFASGGTVFLDEIADLPMATQAKLLRVLESREVLPVGSLHPRPIDVRFIAAANRDLRQLVEQGAFRRDLYFRLNGITLSIPPLRERVDEIPALAQQFVAAAAKLAGVPAPAIARSALEALARHPWTGNVRELRNTMERALVLGEGATILPEHLVLEGDAAPGQQTTVGVSFAPGTGLRDGIHALERARIVDALQRAGNNQTLAAELLGVSRRTLVGRLTMYGMTRPRRK